MQTNTDNPRRAGRRRRRQARIARRRLERLNGARALNRRVRGANRINRNNVRSDIRPVNFANWERVTPADRLIGGFTGRAATDQEMRLVNELNVATSAEDNYFASQYLRAMLDPFGQGGSRANQAYILDEDSRTSTCAVLTRTYSINGTTEGTSCMIRVQPPDTFGIIGAVTYPAVSGSPMTGNHSFTADQSAAWITASSTGTFGSRIVNMAIRVRATDNTQRISGFCYGGWTSLPLMTAAGTYQTVATIIARLQQDPMTTLEQGITIRGKPTRDWYDYATAPTNWYGNTGNVLQLCPTVWITGMSATCTLTIDVVIYLEQETTGALCLNGVINSPTLHDWDKVKAVGTADELPFYCEAHSFKSVKSALLNALGKGSRFVTKYGPAVLAAASKIASLTPAAALI